MDCKQLTKRVIVYMKPSKLLIKKYVSKNKIEKNDFPVTTKIITKALPIDRAIALVLN